MKKLILSTHRKLCHIGPVAVMAKLNDDFWILRALQFVTNTLSKCLSCQYEKALCHNPEMAVLPDVRKASFIVPFKHCGIDAIGPFRIKITEGRSVFRKTYVLAITCMSTRAVQFLVLQRMSGDCQFVS